MHLGDDVHHLRVRVSFGFSSSSSRLLFWHVVQSGSSTPGTILFPLNCASPVSFLPKVARTSFVVRTCKRCFCSCLFLQFADSGGAIHKASTLHGFALFPNSKNCFASWIHVGNRHCRYIQLQPCVPPQKKPCNSCATLALCVSRSSGYFSPSFVQHLHWNVLCVSVSRTSASSRHVPGVARFCSSILLRSHVNQVRRNLQRA